MCLLCAAGCWFHAQAQAGGPHTLRETLQVKPAAWANPKKPYERQQQETRTQQP
jgi:hypothetical protein